MSASLSTPQGDELSSAEVREVRDSIKSTVDAQLGTFPGGARELLVRELGAERYEKLIADIANNVTQGLL